MSTIQLFIAALLSIFALYTSTAFASINSDNEPNINQLIQLDEISPQRLLVKFREASSPADILLSMHNYVTASVRALVPQQVAISQLAPQFSAMHQWRVITFESGVNLGDAYQNLLSHPDVETVVPDIKVRISATPNDLSEQLWGLHNSGQTGGHDDADIDAPEAWDIIHDADNVIVAIIDTGIDYTHPDLADNIWTNSGEIPGNGLDDDGNGYIDDIHGWDFVNNDADPMDDHYHGTHVSGTIAASGNNDQGITGVAWKAQLMGLKFLDENGRGYSSDAIEALLYAVSNGAVISNNSWGRYASTYFLEAFDAPLADAIAFSGTAGHLFVAAAGNDYALTDGKYSAYPAGITLSNIISVAATNENDELASFSNYGLVEVDIAAPGVDIYSTTPNNTYGHLSGTSMAAPHVAGVAALLFSMLPDLSPLEVKAILMNSSDKIPALAGIVSSEGRLNAANAVTFLTEGPACASYSSTPQAHIDAGRANACGLFDFYACALGSEQQIGSRYSATSVELIESLPGVFRLGQCQSNLDIPPVINLEGARESRIFIGDNYTLPPANASDREDGNLSSGISVSGSVDASIAGNYIVDYDVTDSHGNNAATERRFIQVLDSDNAPLIYLFGKQCVLPLFCEYMPIEVNTPYIEPGYIAVDELDGELTDQVVSSGSVLTYTSVIGRFKVQYDVQDSSGQHFENRENIFRDIFVLHPDKPYVHIEQADKQVYHAEGTCCLSSRIEPFSVDMVDGINAVETDGEVNPDVAGTYVLRQHYTDSDGFSDEVYQIVHVVPDVTPPTVRLIGDAEVWTTVGEYWRDPWVSATDDLDQYPWSRREGNLDLNTLGTYQLRYWAQDDSNNLSKNIYRTVHVVSPCTEYSDTNANHITEGRAYACGFYNFDACALGSQENLGSRWLYSATTIHQAQSGSDTYYLGYCP